MNPQERLGTRARLNSRTANPKRKKNGRRAGVSILTALALVTGAIVMAPSVAALPLQGTASVDVREVPANTEEVFTVSIDNPVGSPTINWVRLATPGLGGASVLQPLRAGAAGWNGSIVSGGAVFTQGSIPGGQSRDFELLAKSPQRASDLAYDWSVLVSDNSGTSTQTQLARTPGSLAGVVRVLSAQGVDLSSPNGALDSTATEGQMVHVIASYSNFGTSSMNLAPSLTSSAPSDQIGAAASRQIAPETTIDVDFPVTLGAAGTRTFTSRVLAGPNSLAGPGLPADSEILTVATKPTFSYVSSSMSPIGGGSGSLQTSEWPFRRPGYKRLCSTPRAPSSG
jgi:hypothetical protein